jgi:DNA-binding NarL/FixJ family response regulator
MSGKTRIVLADEDPIVLNGLRNLIATEGDLDLIGEATNGAVALAIIRERQPDVAIVDIFMPGLNGIVLTRRLAGELPSVSVLVLTLHEDRGFVRQAFDAGARGYVLKRSASQYLVQAIRAVAGGNLYIDPAIASRVFDVAPKHAGRSGNTHGELTEREAEVLKLIALGFTNKEIAHQLGVGIKSVETYKARGTEKLGLKTRAALVRYAARQGWLADA